MLKLKEIYNKLLQNEENKNDLTYLISNIVGFGIPFLQNFILAYFLDVNIYGDIVIFFAIFSTLTVIFTFGYDNLIIRYFFDENYSDKKLLINDVLIIWSLTGIFFVFIFVFVGLVYYNLISIKGFSFVPDFIFLILSSFIFSSFTIFQAYYIAQIKPKNYFLNLVISKFLIFVVTILFIYHYSYLFLSIAYLLVSIIIFILLAFSEVRLPIKFNKGRLKEMFSFSYPLFIRSLSGFGFSHGFKLILGAFISPTSLAIYNLGSQFSSIYYLLTSAFLQSLNPRAYSALNNKFSQSSLKFYYKKLIPISLLILFSLFIFAIIFFNYFKNGSYIKSLNVLPLLLLGQFILLITSYNFVIISFKKKTIYLTISSLIGTFISIISLPLTLRFFDIIGAALSIFLGYISIFIIMRYYRKKIL